jgi:hypothetical protein
MRLPSNQHTVGASGSKDHDSPKEMLFTSKVGPHSTMLWQSSLWGEGKDVEVISPTRGGTLRIKLKKALVSSYTVAGGGDEPIETWTLTAESITFETPGEKPADDKVKN